MFNKSLAKAAKAMIRSTDRARPLGVSKMPKPAPKMPEPQGRGYPTPQGRGYPTKPQQKQPPPYPVEPKRTTPQPQAKMMKKGGAVSASRRADGIAQRGKTKGRVI